MPSHNFKKRLKLLERGLIDTCGLVPGSEAWIDFWEERILEIYAGKAAPPGSIPLPAWDAVVRRAMEWRK